MSRTLRAQLYWLLCLPLLPLVLLQAIGLRRRIPRLPEARGDARGSSLKGKQPNWDLLVLGESTAVGVGATEHRNALPGFLAEGLASNSGCRVTWHLLGQNGATLGRTLSLLRDSETPACKLACVFLGVNDVFRLSPLRSWKMGIVELHKELTHRGCEAVFYSSVPPIERFQALPRALRLVLGVRAELLNAHLASAFERSENAVFCSVDFPRRQDCLAEDGVHPSEVGYKIWAEQIVLRIGSHFAETSV